MQDGSPSQRSWVEECDEELPSPGSLGAGSLGSLLGELLACGPVKHLTDSDSEGFSGSDLEPPSPPPAGKGKSVAMPSLKRRRARRHRRHRCGVEGFMAAARRAQATNLPPSPRRRPSPPCHPRRLLRGAESTLRAPPVAPQAGSARPTRPSGVVLQLPRELPCQGTVSLTTAMLQLLGGRSSRRVVPTPCVAWAGLGHQGETL